MDDRRQTFRRSGDVDLGALNQRVDDIADDVVEVKQLLAENYVPRIKDLEDWRLTWAATELEREKNRHRQAENTISKRQFVLGVLSILIAMVTCAAGIVALVLSNT